MKTAGNRSDHHQRDSRAIQSRNDFRKKVLLTHGPALPEFSYLPRQIPAQHALGHGCANLLLGKFRMMCSDSAFDDAPKIIAELKSHLSSTLNSQPMQRLALYPECILGGVAR